MCADDEVEDVGGVEVTGVPVPLLTWKLHLAIGLFLQSSFIFLTNEAVEYPEGTEVPQIPATDPPLTKAPVNPTSQQNPFPKLPVHNDQAASAQLGAPSTLPRQLLAKICAARSADVSQTRTQKYSLTRRTAGFYFTVSGGLAV